MAGSSDIDRGLTYFGWYGGMGGMPPPPPPTTTVLFSRGRDAVGERSFLVLGRAGDSEPSRLLLLLSLIWGENGAEGASDSIFFCGEEGNWVNTEGFCLPFIKFD